MTTMNSQESIINKEENYGLSEEDIDSYVSGKCMYLAGAIHRKFGWDISLTIDFPEDKGCYIGHAWAVNPINGYCVDIDGSYPLERNGWIAVYSEVKNGLNEKQLFEITEKTSGRPLSQEEWENDILEATQVLEKYLIPKYNLGNNNKHKIK